MASNPDPALRSLRAVVEANKERALNVVASGEVDPDDMQRLMDAVSGFLPHAPALLKRLDRQASRLTVGDIDKLMDGVRQSLAIETSATEQQHCGGLLVALEDLKRCVEATA